MTFSVGKLGAAWPLVLLLGSPLTAVAQEGVGMGAMTCVQGYANAFAQIDGLATALKLRSETAEETVRVAFKQRPDRCEAGAYEYFIDQYMRFATRALRSGATEKTPKEGWVRAASAAAAFAPRQVPQAEYYEDLQRYKEARKALAGLIAEAGGGPLPSAMLYSFERAAPAPGAYGPKPAPLSQPPDAPPPPPLVVEPSGSAPPASPQVVPARVPRVPVPPWGVAGLHESVILIRQNRVEEAAQRLDQIIRWMESQP